jgi:hypothetical protein
LIGACSCREVRFEIQKPSLWCAHCHCTQCQMAHGAGVVTWVGCEADSVAITDTENRLSWYKSSKEAERAFCSRCGSSLFFRSTRWPGELHIARALITGDVDREPTGHAHYDSHVNWLELADDLPGREDKSGT